MFSSITFFNRLIDVRTNNLIEKDRLTKTRACKQQQKNIQQKNRTASKIIATKQKTRTQQKSYIEQ